VVTGPQPRATPPEPAATPRLFTLVTGGHPGAVASDEERLSLDEVARWGVRKHLARHLFRYRQARAVTHDLRRLYNPLKTAVLLRLLAWGRCWLEDDEGVRQQVTAFFLARLAAAWCVGRVRATRILHEAEQEVSSLARDFAARQANSRQNRAGAGPPLYLRTDLVFDVEAGGAVAHISGVVNNLRFRGLRPVMATTAAIPLVVGALEVHVLSPGSATFVSDDVWRLSFNKDARREVEDLLAGRVPAFIYHRSTAYSYAAAQVALDLGVPLVLEYNGSDAWISRHWGNRPIRREDLVVRIEDLNLRAAALVVVVSDALAEEVTSRDVPRGRVLVVPNGVDPERFSPAVDGTQTRARYGIGPGELVVGFVGTFGAWHGAEILARAFASIAVQPDIALRLLMIGAGPRLPATRALVEAAGLSKQVVFTGLVPQEEGPAHMAACDILVAPHIPNPDGSAFFGSPTKLFEYLAMGKAVVASALDQLGQVVIDGGNGVLVPPGDPEPLAIAIRNLAHDPELRARLGAQARRDALERHTWAQHTGSITCRLEELLSS
jgi:glycosyltransferase involved in cell wall biosynthesis